MDVSRRELMMAGALLGASGLLLNDSEAAQSGDEAAVTQSIETLRKATFDADNVKLAQVVSDHLSYGHSDGRAQTKDQFITGVMTRTQVVKSLAFPELKVAVAGNAAIARHIWLSESEREGKATTTRIGVLQVWQKQDSSWKLLARQGFRLPA